ncbi:MAG: hypothetical protein CME34_19630 [Gordonia sp.]|nr:hypothetical protein [Gordonia sp. (in: high G+C Gram-positive bacteria)]
MLLLVSGLALMAFGRYVDSRGQSGFVSALSSNVSGTLLIAGIVGIALDQWVDRDRGASLSRLIENVMLRVMAKLVPALRDSVIQAFADNVNNLSIVASDELRSRIRTCGRARCATNSRISATPSPTRRSPVRSEPAVCDRSARTAPG